MNYKLTHVFGFEQILSGIWIFLKIPNFYDVVLQDKLFSEEAMRRM
jgi:hypothetical protein